MKKVIFIDDEPDISEAVRIILEDEGYSVKTLSYFESTQEIEDFKPNIILLDMLLAGGSGEKLSKKIRESKILRKTPIVILSANPISEIKALAIECRASSFITKPFDLDTLLDTVKKFSN